MKKIFVLLVLAQMLGASLQAQKPGMAKSLKEVMTLKIDRPGGANGACVAWHPGQKKYYAAQAGNATFPMEVFDVNGKMLSPDTLTTMFDVRGLWYNPNRKTLQANGYDNPGWSEYKLNAKGIPVAVSKLSVVTTQPDAQSVGVFDGKKNVVYFLDVNSAGIERHRFTEGSADTIIKLHLGAATKNDIKENDSEGAMPDYNQNAIVFTGTAHAEIGLLNVTSKQIELYDLSNGLMTETLKLPENAPVESSLNFSYSNGIYWLNEKTARVWHGYK